MQAIVTKYLGPTNFKGARVRATCAARSVIVSWDHAKNPSENHAAVAESLARAVDWRGRWVGGSVPTEEGYVFVCVDGAGREEFNVGLPITADA